MLVPAISRKLELEELFAEHIYDDDMFLYTAYPYENSIPDLSPKWNDFKWAIVNPATDKVIGYFAYYIDNNNDTARSFGLYSFDKGNHLIGRDVYKKLKELISEHHRVEWYMIGGNPAERAYDKFFKKFNGSKVVLHGVIKDKLGKYRDSIIYEILREDIRKWLILYLPLYSEC